MSTVINGVRSVKSRLEHNTSCDLSGYIIVLSRSDLQTTSVLKIFFTKGTDSVGAYTGSAGGGLKLAGPLPFRASGEPKHEPVIWIVFFGKVGREEKR